MSNFNITLTGYNISICLYGNTVTAIIFKMHQTKDSIKVITGDEEGIILNYNSKLRDTSAFDNKGKTSKLASKITADD